MAVYKSARRRISNRVKFSAALSIAALAAVGGTLPKIASAATDTWNDTTGVANDNWDSVGAWTGGNSPPQASDNLLYSGSAAYAVSNNDLNVTIASITFNNGAQAYTLTGNTLTMTDGLYLQGNQGNTDVVNMGITGTTNFLQWGNGGSAGYTNSNLTLGASDTFGDTTTGLWMNALAGTATLNVGANTETFDGGASIGSSTTSNSITLNISGTGGTVTFAGTFQVGGGTAANTTSTIVNMAGLSNFSLTATGGGLYVGAGPAGTSNAHNSGTLTLANTSNTINVGSIIVGNTNGNNGNSGTINLGAGTNTLDATTIDLGFGKAQGTIDFLGTNGSVIIAGTGGGTNAAAITVGHESSGSATSATNALSLAGHNATVTASTIIDGDQAGSTAAQAVGAITFDTGFFNVQTLELAVHSSGASNATGTFTLGTNTSSTGVLNVTSAFFLADNTSGQTSNGTFIINGGTANIGANMTIPSTAGTSNTVLTLNGGTLNMEGNSIATSAAKVTTVTFGTNGSTLENLGGTGINGAGLTVGNVNGTGATTLILAGANPFTGGASINSTSTLDLQGSITGSAVSNAGTLNFNGSGAASITNALTGAGAVNQNGSGTTTLSSGSNNETGALAVSSGTLLATGTMGATTLSGGTLGTAGTPGSGTLTFSSLSASAGDLLINLGTGSSSDVIHVTGTNAGSISLTGTNAFEFGLAGTPTLGTNVAILTSGGTATATSTGFSGGVGPTTNTGRTFFTPYVGGSAASGGIALDGSIGTNADDIYVYIFGNTPATLYWDNKSGDGQWNVQSSANWNDTTETIDGDVFYQFDNVNFDDAHNSGNSYTVTLNTTVTPASINVNNSAGNYVITGSGHISGATSLVKEGSDSLTLSTVNYYTGGTTIGNGTLYLGVTGGLPNGGTLTLGDASNDSGTLDLHGFNATVGALTTVGTGTQTITDSTSASTFTYASGSTTATTFAGTISGTNLSLSVASGSLTLSGTDTYSGGTIISSGATLSVSSSIGGAVTDNGTFNVNNNEFITDFNGAGTGSTVIANGDTLTVAPTTNDTYSGVISGSTGALTINGLASTSLALNGTNTYTGATNINGGTVYAGTFSALGATTGAAVTIASGATLDIGGIASQTAGGFGAKAFNIAGTGVAGSYGVLQNNGGANGANGTNFQESAFENVTLTGNATIGGNNEGAAFSNDGRFDIARSAGTLNLNGYTLTKDGTDQVSLTGLGALGTSAGNIVVDQGILSIENTFKANNLNDFIIYNNTTPVTPDPNPNPGALGNVIAGFYETTAATDVTTPLVFNGPGIEAGQEDSAVTSTINSNIFLNNNVTFELLNAHTSGGMILAGNISDIGTYAATFAGITGGTVGTGPGSITLTSGTLSLAGTNTFSGGITIAGGTLLAGSNTGIPSGSILTFGSAGGGSGTMDLDGFNATVGGLATVGTGTQTITDSNTSAGSLLTFAGGVNPPSTFSGAITGSVLNLTVASGSLTLSGTGNTYTGGTTINNGGTLTVSGSIGGVVTDNGVFNVNNNLTITDFNGGTTGSTVIAPGDTLTVAPTTSDTFAGVISDPSGSLTINGAGTLTLSGANTYSGTTTVTAGTLLVTGSLLGTGAVSVNGGSLGGGAGAGGSVGNVTLTSGTLQGHGASNTTGTLSMNSLITNSGGTMLFDVGSDAAVDMLNVTNTVTFNSGSIAFNLDRGATPTSPENVAILTSNGLVNPNNLTGFSAGVGPTTVIGRTSLTPYVGGHTPGGDTGPNIGTSPNDLYLYLLGSPASLFWTGATSGGSYAGDSKTWDVATAPHTANYNWYNAASSNPGNVDEFYQNDSVTFGDTWGTGAAVINYTVTLNTTVSPGSMTVNNSAGNYVISGGGSIAGATGLLKQGSDSLTLSNTGVNTYSGTTAIQNGSLILGAAGALPTNASVTFGDGSGDSGTLDLGGNAATVSSLAVVGGTNDLITSSSGAPTLTFAGGSSPDSFSGNVSGSGLNLVVSSGSLTLSGTESYGGYTTVNAGLLTISGIATGSTNTSVNGGTLTISGSDTTTGSTSIASGGTLTVGSGGSFSATSINNNVGGILNVGGTISTGAYGTITNSGTLKTTSSIAIVGNLNGTGAVSLGTTGDMLTIQPTQADTIGTPSGTTGGVISGSGALVITSTGVGSMALNGANTYTGTTTINSGIVYINTSTSLGSVTGGNVTIGVGGTLDITGDATANNLNFGAGRTFFIAGGGASGTAGAIQNNGASQESSFENITLTGSALIGGSARFDVGRNAPGGNLNLSGYTLTVNDTALPGLDIDGSAGATTVNFGNNGNIVVTAGTMAFDTNNVLTGTGNNYVVFQPSTFTQFYGNASGNTVTGTTPLVYNGGGIYVYNAHAAVTAITNQPIYMNSSVTFANNNDSLTLNGNISDITATSLSSGALSGVNSINYINGTGATSTTLSVAAGTGSITIGQAASTGTLTLAGPDNTFSGGITINGGTLVGAAANAFSTGGLTVAAGTIELDGFNENVAYLLDSSNTGTISNTSSTAATLTFGSDNDGDMFSGAITNGGTSAALSLVDASSGTPDLAGALTYTGTTSIGTGGLEISGANTDTLSGNISGGALTVGDNSTATKLTLSGATNTYVSTTVNDFSTVIGGVVNAFGTGPLTINSGGAMQLGGFNQSVGSLTGHGNISNAATSAATLTIGGNGGYFFGAMANGAGGGAFSLTAANTGTEILEGALSYTGTTTINGGTTVELSGNNTDTLSGPVTGAGTLIVGQGGYHVNATLSNSGNSFTGLLKVNGSGAVLSATGSFGATTLQSGTLEATGATPGAGTLTLNSLSANGGYLLFNIGSSSSHDQITVGNAAYLGSSAALEFNLIAHATPTTPENVTILTSTGLTNNMSSFTAGVGPTTSVGRVFFTPYVGGHTPGGDGGPNIGTVSNDLYLYVTGGLANLFWTGTTSGGSYAGDGKTWDMATAPHTANYNWYNAASSNPGNVDEFYQNDNVTFDDSHNTGHNYTVTLNVSVIPNSITVNNSAGNYVITGGGSIAGSTTLTKEGTDSLTLSTANTYSGATIIENGTLIQGVTGALPTNANVSFGDLSGDSGTLDLGGFAATVAGLSVVGGTNNIITTSLGSPTLTYAGGSATSTFSGAITGAALSLTMQSGSLTLSGANTYGGGTTINSGATLSVASTGSDTNAGSMTNNVGGILNVGGSIGGLITNNGTLNATSATASVVDLTGSGAVSLGTTGDVLSIAPTLATDTISGLISGSGGLTIAGTLTSLLTVLAANTYTGTTTITSGTLQVGNGTTGTAILGTGPVSITGGILQIESDGNQTWANNFSGTGPIIVLSNPSNHVESMTFSGTNTSFNGSITLQEDARLELSAAANFPGPTSSITVDAGAGFFINTSTSYAGSLNVAGFGFGAATYGEGGSSDANGYGAIRFVGSNTLSGTITIASVGAMLGTEGTETLSGLVTGTGQLQIGSTSATNSVVLTDANDNWSGGTAIYDGILRTNVALTNDPLGNVSFGSATGYLGTTGPTSGELDIDGTSQTVTGLAVAAGTTNVITSSVTTGSTLTYLQGTNPASIYTGLISGTGLALNVSSGSLTLSDANTFTGGTTIGSAGTLTVTGSIVDAVTDNGMFNVQNNFSITDLTGANTGNLDISSGDTLTVAPTGSNTDTFAGTVNSAGNLTVNGSAGSTLVLSNTGNTQSGNLVVTAGTLEATGSFGVTTNTGTGTLAAAGATPSVGGTLTLNSLTDAAGTLLSHVGNGSVSDLITVSTSATLSGTASFSFNIVPTSTPTIGANDKILTAVSLANTITNFTAGVGPTTDYGRTLFTPYVGGSAASGGIAGDISIQAGSNNMYVYIAGSLGADTLYWTGTAVTSPGTGDGMTWDQYIPTSPGTANYNWYNQTTSAIDQMYSLDNVNFGDTWGTTPSTVGHYTVTLNTTVTPGSITVNNSMGNYVISGTGAIAGSTGLVKNGPDSLTLENTGIDTYSGGVTLNTGTLNINTATALGTGTLTINGGTLGDTAAGVVTLTTQNAQIWAGSFGFNAVAGHSLNLGTGAVTLNSNPTITLDSFNTLTIGGVISNGSGNNLTIATSGGTPILDLTANNTFTGGVTVNGGELEVSGSGGNTALGSGNVIVNTGGTLVGSETDAFGYEPNTAPATITINGGTVNDLGTSSYRITLPNITFGTSGGTLTSTAGNNGDVDGNYSLLGNGTTATVTTSGGSTTSVISAAEISPQISTIFNVAAGSVTGGPTPGVDLLVSSKIVPFGVQTVTMSGSGVLQFSGANTYTGTTIVSNGTLSVTGSLLGTGAVTVNGGTLAGPGGSVGNISMSTGTVQSHLAANTVGTLTMNSLATTGGNLAFDVDNAAAADLLTVTGTSGATLGNGTSLSLSLDAGAIPTNNENIAILTSSDLVLGTSLAAINGDLASTVAGSVKLYAYQGGAVLGFTDGGTEGTNVNDIYLYASSAVAQTIPAMLYWNDAAGVSPNNVWDINTTANWNDTTDTINPAKYQENGTSNDTVTFDDAHNTSGNYQVALNTTVSPGSVTVNNSAGNYVISGTGNISGAGSLTKSGTDSLTLATNNSYSGGTQIQQGTLIVANTSAIPTGSSVILGNGANSGTLDLGGSGATVGSLAVSGTGSSNTITNNGASTAALTFENGTSSFSGTIVNGSNTTALNVNSGSLTLTAANTYSGGTTISGGTLALSGSGSIADSALINVESAGTLNVSSVSFTLGASTAQTLEGTGNVTGNVTVGADGTLSPGDAIGTLSVSGTVAFNPTAAFDAQVTPTSGVNDQLSAGGNVTLGGNETLSATGALTNGESFTVIQGNVYGNFAGVTLPTLTAGLSWSTPLNVNNSISGASNTYQQNYTYSVTNSTPVYSSVLPHGDTYAGLNIEDQAAGSRNTNVQFLDANAAGGVVTAATSTTVSVSFANRTGANPDLISDVATVNGTNSDTYVLELNYIAADVTNGTLSPVLAVEHNNVFESAVLLDPTQQEVAGAYNSSTDDVLGDYGIDPTNHQVWAVLDYSAGDNFGVYQRIPGDLSGSGTVTPSDLGLVATNLFGSTGGLWSKGDFQGAGLPTDTVTAGDLGLVRTNLFATEPTGSSEGVGGGLITSGGSPAPVPEPGSLALLAIGAGFTLLRRKSKKA